MKNKIVHILLWVAQILVAFMFFFGFYTKVLQPLEDTAQMLPWAAEYPTLAAFTGIVELLGAIGLIFPALLRIQPKWTTYAAYGGILLMLAAIVFHATRGETEVIGFNIFLIVMLGFIIWGRSKKVPILPKA